MPPSTARAVGITPATGALRALFAQPPATIDVDLELPEASELPVSARQLLKLMATSPAFMPRDVIRRGAGRALIRCRLGATSVEFAGDRLAEPTSALVSELFVELFGPASIFDVSQRFAGGVARLEVLQILTQHMLASADVDASLRILLSGLTAGDGLGFDRAAVFVYDEIRERFVGSGAVGPGSDEEAHEIWEAVEIEGRTIEQIVSSASQRSGACELHSQVYGVEVVPKAGGEAARALAVARPQRFAGPTTNPGLACLGATGPYVLAAAQPRGAPLALVFVDNLYSGREITGAAMDGLATFLGQTALVLDNLMLLREVERLARFDGLTGVLNRREFEARVSVEEMRCLRAEHACALLILDLDNFKAINDSLGHSAGDAVLKQTGELLTQTLRAHDLVGRFGGDEFVVLLPETSGGDLERIIRRIGKLAWEQEIAMSIGGAAFPMDCGVPSGLFSIADRNLLRAKRAGRQRACIGDDGDVFSLAGTV